MSREHIKMMMHEELTSDSTYSNLISRATSSGYTLPNSTTLNALEIFLDYMDVQGYTAKAEVLGIFAYNDLNTRSFAKINIVNPTGVLFGEELYNGGTIDYKTIGFKLNSTSATVWARINLNFIYDSVSAYKYKYGSGCRIHILGEVASVTTTNNAIDGIAGTAAEQMLYSTTVLPKIVQGTGVGTEDVPNLQGTGLKAVTRVNNSQTYYSVNKNVVYTHSRILSTSTYTNLFYLGYSNNVSGNQGYSFSFIGGGLTTTEIANIRTAFNTYLVNIGLTAFA